MLVFGGVLEVGYVSVKASHSSTAGTSDELYGIILLIIAQFFSGTQFIIEEKLLADYYLHPSQVVGTEGMWGLVYYLAALSLMQLKTCGYGSSPLNQLC